MNQLIASRKCVPRPNDSLRLGVERQKTVKPKFKTEAKVVTFTSGLRLVAACAGAQCNGGDETVRVVCCF